MANYFAPEALCEIHHSKRRMTIVISYLCITVFCLFARIRSRSLFSSAIFSIFLRARAHLGILLIAV
ncbi:hypothetical protein AH448_01370 [Salmonella enterica subsp. diarizonae]|uniref:Uncharacterized protein n=5 Tax=Salmonella enterica TaxID=28901 RepID=A0A2I5HQ17_SALDZ|nr:hypothetical protein LFZ53_00810 [Salmonella enterica subsp. diarizonae serovar 50:k:z str. MZ0080]ASG85752.1 hypothetical protein LFZ55_00900 [Salmonella enterica subsp. diarizonae serovar 65:c:z str. SA20044251]ATW57669.1 hypothetical protein CNQ75_21100 [Salmonella enterica subsp. diarizonae]AXC74827.1 hypothetical protein DOE59_00820 [Salmonella enterica subsp. diarizonae serovar 48:i:z]EAM2670007.1 hypothetical protein [Salmonella enterica]EAW1160103.1 hypothetical protein [Salmonella 